MTCLPRELFVPKEYLNQLTCDIGLGVFNDPVALPCHHIYCKGCVESWLAKDGTCPKCRHPCNQDSLKRQLTLYRLVQNAIAVCSNTGCKWTGPYRDLEKHLLAHCPESSCACSFGCGTVLKRAAHEEHKKQCKFRLVKCPDCSQLFSVPTLASHEPMCPAKLTPCPLNCGIQIPRGHLAFHTAEECSNHIASCRFAESAGCDFQGKPPELEAHYASNTEKHLLMLAKMVGSLEEKINSYEQRTLVLPQVYGITKQAAAALPGAFIEVFWDNGEKLVTGSGSSLWSLHLSTQQLVKPFKARLKIVSLNATDMNSWKVCIGVFTNRQFEVGSWCKFKNGYGYAIGCGHKANTEAQAYGAPCSTNDVVTIEYDGGNLTFAKNGVSQGIAFQKVSPPLYLAVALSDSGHCVELMDVYELNR